MQEIICLLDKSGSMQKIAEEATMGFNAFLEEQKAVGDANLTVIWFDDKFHVDYQGKLSEVPPLQQWPYGNMTALLDAIGKTFHFVRDRFSREKPEKVVLAILTDGHENMSTGYSQKAVAELIIHHREKYAWEVIYLGADQDSWGVAEKLNIARNNTFDWSSSNAVQGMSVYSTAVTRSRIGGDEESDPQAVNSN